LTAFYELDVNRPAIRTIPSAARILSESRNSLAQLGLQHCTHHPAVSHCASSSRKAYWLCVILQADLLWFSSNRQGQQDAAETF